MLTVLAEFRRAIANARALIGSAHTVDSSGTPLWSADARAVIVEAAFLKVFIAWETTLEAAFLSFLTGTPSASGTAVVRYASPSDRDHARSMLVGTQRFVDWSTPDTVRKLARVYFDSGHPFETVLSAIHADIIDLKTIRNAAAHLSSSTSTSLDALASRKLSTPVANTTPSALLLSVDPASSTGGTILDSYLELLDSAAERLVHA